MRLLELVFRTANFLTTELPWWPCDVLLMHLYARVAGSIPTHAKYLFQSFIQFLIYPKKQIEEKHRDEI